MRPTKKGQNGEVRQGRAAGASCRGRREMGVRGRGEVQGCAGLKENGGGPFYSASCEEVEGFSPGFLHFCPEKYSLQGRIFATVMKILSCTSFSPAQ